MLFDNSLNLLMFFILPFILNDKMLSKTYTCYFITNQNKTSPTYIKRFLYFKLIELSNKSWIIGELLMSHELSIKAAIFDMDGLLINSEPLWSQAEKEILTRVSQSLKKKYKFKNKKKSGCSYFVRLSMH
ncbi:hypothetical protein CBG25_14030 [Arsenophonus sp. ENCA]|nr:hypothetical protein CBG25_14030 [Arsenophonus sp. ENCA]